MGNHKNGKIGETYHNKVQELRDKFTLKTFYSISHLIIAQDLANKVRDRYFSFASEGLIEQYELDFLGLKMRGVAGTK